MRIGVFPADAGGCGHYRMIWPAEQVQALGHDVTILRAGDDGASIYAILKDRTGMLDRRTPHGVKTIPYATTEVVGLAEAPPFDVVVVQRPLGKLLAQLIPHLQRAGVAVVVELDDDFLRVDPRNLAWIGTRPHLNPNDNYEWLQLAVREADLVTVSTPALRDLYGPATKHEPIVLPNYLPAHAYAAEGHKWHGDGAVVGWSGSLKSHPNDLPEVGNAIARLARHPDYAGCHIIGTGEGVLRQLGVPDDGRFAAEGAWVPLDEYHPKLDAVDVAFVPLKPQPFNECKSWLKGLEFAARGIPAVCTPTGPYKALAAREGCLLADSPKAWYRQLSRLISDHAYWNSMSERVWEVAWSLRLSAYAEDWAMAWTHARALRLAA